MDTSKLNTGLQNIIIRLQDAEKGYSEISKAVANPTLIKWLERYSSERHQMHKVLEEIIAASGGDATVKTSLLGDIHRMFIDVKINSTSAQNEFNSVVTEIERGSSYLIEEYKEIMDNVKMAPNVLNVLKSQKSKIENEINNILELKEEFETVEA